MTARPPLQQATPEAETTGLVESLNAEIGADYEDVVNPECTGLVEPSHLQRFDEMSDSLTGFLSQILEHWFGEEADGIEGLGWTARAHTQISERQMVCLYRAAVAYTKKHPGGGLFETKAELNQMIHSGANSYLRRANVNREN